MKKLIYGTLFLAIVGLTFVGCKKQSEPINTVEHTKSNKENNVSNFNKTTSNLTDYGDIHNAILDKFYSYNGDISSLTFMQKMTLIDQYLHEVNTNIAQGAFLQFLNENPSHKANLIILCTRDVNQTDANSILSNLRDNNQISSRVYYYSNLIIQAYNADNSNIALVSTTLSDIENSIINDGLLNAQEQENLLKTISIGKGSASYWQNHEIPTPGKAPAWLGADAAGGTTAITSGLAGWASAFGPWGSIIAVVGTAAAASAFS